MIRPWTFALDHVPRRRLSEEHGRLQVDLIDRIEGLLGDLEDRLFDLQPGAVDQHVETAESGGDGIDRSADLVDRGHVAGKPNGLVTGLA